jgi:molybdopterin synthase sulfur carrier subunit
VIDVLYFAWLRERIGLPREKVETRPQRWPIWSPNCGAARPLCGWLSPIWRPCGWRWTRNLPHSTRRLAGVREVAFFPPMTGG